MAEFESKFPEWRKKYPDVSDIYPEDDYAFLWDLRDRGLITPSMYKLLYARLERPEEPEVTYAEIWKEYRREVGDAMFDKIKEWFRIAYHEVLVSMWDWILEQIRSLIDLVTGTIAPAVKDAWESVSAKFQELARTGYEFVKRVLGEPKTLTPERAPVLASQLYLGALGSGMAAHGVSAAFELLHPLKSMGLHSTAAMIGDYAQFGRISNAIAGTLISRVLGQAMTYNWQNM